MLEQSVARTMGLNSCSEDKGNDTVSAACDKAAIMHLLSRSLICDDGSCRLSAALVSCVNLPELTILLLQEARRPPELGAGDAPALHHLQWRGQDGRQQD